MKNTFWRLFLFFVLCTTLLACGQKNGNCANIGNSNFHTETKLDILNPNYVLYRTALSGNDVVKVICASSSIFMERLTAIEKKINAATLALKGSGTTAPCTPQKEFFEAVDKFLPHLIADFDFAEGFYSSACLGQCSSSKKTEVDVLRGRGIYLIDTLIDVRKTRLPNCTLTFHFDVKNLEVGFDSLTQGKIERWAKMGALEIIKNADSVGQYQNDSEREIFLSFLEGTITKIAYKYCANGLEGYTRGSIALQDGGNKIDITLPSAFEISNVYLGVYHAKTIAEISSCHEIGRVHLGFRTQAFE